MMWACVSRICEGLRVRMRKKEGRELLCFGRENKIVVVN